MKAFKEINKKKYKVQKPLSIHHSYIHSLIHSYRYIENENGYYAERVQVENQGFRTINGETLSSDTQHSHPIVRLT